MFSDDATVTVYKYYLYRAVGGPGFMYPIYVLYLLSHDLTFAQIGTIGAVQSVAVLVGELPTGYVGDRIGRRNSLLVGQLLFALSATGFVVSEGFVGFLAAFVVLSVGQTFVSGSGDAWLYDTLDATLGSDRFSHVRGRGGAIGQWVTAVTMVAGGYLYVVGHVLPFVALGVARVATGLVVLTFPTPDEDGEHDDGGLTVVEAVPVVRERLTTPPVASFVAYAALFFGVVATVDVFVQPIAERTLGPSTGGLLSSLGLAEPMALGVLYAAFTAVSAVASEYASDLEAAVGMRTALVVVPGVTALLVVVPAAVPVLAVPMFFGVRAARSLLRPLAGQFVNDHVESVGRATVLSAVSMVYALARVPFAVGSGVVADLFSPLVAVAALGGAFLVAGGAMQLLRPPVAAGRSDGAADTRVSD
ncbi:MFS transporter [Halorarius halobius]|uniref:MFS transporter n=1 Tax=Halorarius halobius TaxID=2962671 RepID=UPI0020CEDCFC|nr:MFS transporter [Halorarius halobius]